MRTGLDGGRKRAAKSPAAHKPETQEVAVTADYIGPKDFSQKRPARKVATSVYTQVKQVHQFNSSLAGLSTFSHQFLCK